MEKADQLARRFREVILDGKWIANTNFKEQLSGMDWERATKKIGSLNTIAALAYHINYYIGGILNVFEGGGLEIRDKYSFDLPSIRSQEDWEVLLETMWSNAEKFATHVGQMSDAQLEAAFVDPKYGNYRRNIEGVIEHSY
ncbi:MAG: DUF1572 domain-containing protein, partial [Bacteroidetes bacterium]